MIDNRQPAALNAGMTETALLIIWHSRTDTAKKLARSAAEGAGNSCILKRASEVEAEDILNAAGYIFACPENLASMTGEMKEMFDRNYYPVLGQVEGRPYATIIAAGSDGEGAQRQIDRIAKGWRLKRITDSWIVNTDAQSPEEILAPKEVGDADIEFARDMGKSFNEGLSLGIF